MKKTIHATLGIIAVLCLSSSTNAFRNGRIPPRQNGLTHSSSPTARGYKFSSSLEEAERRRIARQIDRMSSMPSLPYSNNYNASATRTRRSSLSSFDMDNAIRVISASLLVTGNTVGSSMFVLPDAVRGVGLPWGSAIFLGLYLYNLISGLLLADVAIMLHESSECDVPSSFKDFVDAALRSDAAGTLTSVLSLLSNGCFLAYGSIAAGPMLADDFFPGMGMDPAVGTCAFASIISLLAITQTNAGLERVANCVVVIVFSSFAALLLPSIENVPDPLATLLTPGTNTERFGNALASAVPLLLSSLMYQNIVPSVTKLLDFDRAKSTVAISIGSLIPMLMYIAWCYASLGGGLDTSTSSGVGAAAFAAFSMSALFVSCLTAVMSLAEECESIFMRRTTTTVEDEVEDYDDGDCIAPPSRFSIPAVIASVMPPVAAALAFARGGDLTGALHFNGAFIVPILYGILPIVLYRGVRQSQARDSPLYSIGGLPQVLLGAGTIGAIGQEIVQEVSCLPHLTG